MYQHFIWNVHSMISAAILYILPCIPNLVSHHPEPRIFRSLVTRSFHDITDHVITITKYREVIVSPDLVLTNEKRSHLRSYESWHVIFQVCSYSFFISHPHLLVLISFLSHSTARSIVIRTGSARVSCNLHVRIQIQSNDRIGGALTRVSSSWFIRLSTLRASLLFSILRHLFCLLLVELVDLFLYARFLQVSWKGLPSYQVHTFK